MLGLDLLFFDGYFFAGVGLKLSGKIYREIDLNGRWSNEYAHK